MFFDISHFFMISFLQAQDVKMSFPHLKGKTYEFLIFQGDKPIVIADTIPENGQFTLSVPKEYKPYTGMSRWLITNTTQGGGLDLFIPGNDFSVSCNDIQPNDSNIIYTDNNGPQTLNRLYAEQQQIFNKYFALEQVMNAYPKTDKIQQVFTKEHERQVLAYDNFQKKLKKEPKYISQFINIVNITLGNATRIGISESEKTQNISDYIANELDWQMLYTSGHWGGVISAWIDIHTKILLNEKLLKDQISGINQKLSPQLQKEFIDLLTRRFKMTGNEKMLQHLDETYRAKQCSIGTDPEFDKRMAAYQALRPGMPAPEINLGNVTLKDIAAEKLIVAFWAGWCSHCAAEMPKLNAAVANKKNITTIAISLDDDSKSYNEASATLGNMMHFCDFKKWNGEAAEKFHVTGTPTYFLLDKDRKIIGKYDNAVTLLEAL